MRGLEKYAPNDTDRHTDRQTERHGDSMTKSAQWGPFSKKGQTVDDTISWVDILFISETLLSLATTLK